MFLYRCLPLCIQRLEDTLQEGSNASLTVRRDGSGSQGQSESGSVRITTRVRDIITRNLAPPEGGWTSQSGTATYGTPSIEQLKEENRILQVLN